MNKQYFENEEEAIDFICEILELKKHKFSKEDDSVLEVIKQKGYIKKNRLEEALDSYIKELEDKEGK